MPYPRHSLIQFGGTIPGGEIWTCGLRMWYPTLGGFPDIETGANFHTTSLADVAGDVAAWFTAPGAQFNPAVKLTFCKFNRINEQGHYRDNAVNTHIYPTPVPGGSAGTMLPPQLSLVLSLQTAKRGPSGRGRIYLPPMTSGIISAATGTVAAGTAAAILAHFKTLVVNLDNWPGQDNALSPQVAVLSKGKDKGVGPGAATRINSLRLGVVMDALHRRRNALVENYQVTPYP